VSAAPFNSRRSPRAAADVLEEHRDDGFLNADAAADYVGVTTQGDLSASQAREPAALQVRRSAPLRPGGATGVGDRPMSAEDRICELHSSAIQRNVRLAGPLTSVQRIPFRARGDLL
jgi:hypothetical protein